MTDLRAKGFLLAFKGLHPRTSLLNEIPNLWLYLFGEGGFVFGNGMLVYEEKDLYGVCGMRGDGWLVGWFASGGEGKSANMCEPVGYE